MKKIFSWFLISSFIFLAGCAANVSLQNNFLQNTNQKIAIAMTPMPTPGVFKEGPQGVVDAIINATDTQSLTDHLQSFNYQSLQQLPTQFASLIQTKGAKPVIESKIIDPSKLNYFNHNPDQYAVRDFAPYQTILGTDKLLLISINQLGAIRKYYGFIPLDAPKAYVVLQGQLIDLTTNQIYWRKNVIVQLAAQSPWYQAPNYPNFDTALNSAISSAKHRLLGDFSK